MRSFRADRLKSRLLFTLQVLDGLDTLLQLSGLVAKLCCTAAGKGVKPPTRK